ncbi:MAG: polysaccharide deacetylase family protein [Oscillospiraceae bacterium]|nr:polysaccharide deacetylase family protein [Oscillospiraceae bacterium]
MLGDYKTPKINPKKPIVALTFDDGPSEYTTRLLDILQQCEGRVSFFVMGNKLEENKSKIHRALNMECEIICHTWDHPDLTKTSGRKIKKQLIDTITEIARITQKVSLMFRPPYGYFNEKVEKIAAKLGLAIILWSIDPRDWESQDAESVYNYIMKDIEDGDIVLCHDVHKSTIEAMERLIPVLTEQGYQLVTVSELLLHKYGKIEPGKVYYK